VLIWYDNEIGYTNRMVELADMVASHLQAGTGSDAPPAPPQEAA
jgi:hypothetical protein